MRNWLSIYKRTLSCDAPRSGHWPAVRRAHLAIEGWCRMCGSIKDLQVHHIEPFHLFPAKELDPGNFITLCETMGVECHLKHGHDGNWKTFNPHIRAIANSPRPGVAATPVKLRIVEPMLNGVGGVRIGLVKGTDFVSKMICRVTRSPYSHALIICPDGSVYESLSAGGVQHNPSVDTRHFGEMVDVLKFPAMSASQSAKVIAFCESQLGKPYDWKDDLWFLTGHTDPSLDTSTWFCSELVFAAFQSAGIDLLDRIQAWQVSPGMLAYPTVLQEAA